MRVLLATDQPDLGQALSLFLAEQRIHVTGVVDDCDRLMTSAATSRPDVVLVDWSLGETVTTRMVADLMRGADPTPVIVLCSSGEEARARTSGATAYATLGDPPDSLLGAIRALRTPRESGAEHGD